MAQVSETQIKSIRPGKTKPFVVDQKEAIRIQARLSWYRRYASLPDGVARYKSRYDTEQGVLMVTAMTEARDGQV